MKLHSIMYAWTENESGNFVSMGTNKIAWTTPQGARLAFDMHMRSMFGYTSYDKPERLWEKQDKYSLIELRN